MADRTMQERLAEVQLQEAEMRLELTTEQVRQHEAAKKQRAADNAKRQAQLKAENAVRIGTARRCRHRQGGTPANPFGGKGATALTRAYMPDGFTRLIMCNAGCRLRLFSPHPKNMAQARRKGESEEQRDARVAKFEADKKRFDELWQQAADEALTPESAQPMDCGNTITLTDSQTGNPVLPTRPCDGYALQM
jgi:hypothetical protein